jgi:predicted nuclease with TOPRIM domain
LEDLTAKLEKLRIEAEDCDLIGRLATDVKKRELFKKLATDLRSMAGDIEAVMAIHQSKIITMDLPDAEAALALARALAENARREVVVRDGDNVELWTVRPKLDS